MDIPNPLALTGSGLEITSIVASIVSVIIGTFAIWLSVVFYKLSNKISEDTKEASKGIKASVDRLESLFDRLYTDTFSMMRDTVSDMRKHIWPEKESTEALTEIEEKADKKIQELRAQVSSELSSIMSQIGHTDKKMSGMEDRLSGLIDKAIQQTRRVESEAQEEISMAEVLNATLSQLKRSDETTIGRLITNPILRRRYPRSMLSEALEILLRERFIEAAGNINDPTSIVKLTRRHAE
jgi:hypothetical protein